MRLTVSLETVSKHQYKVLECNGRRNARLFYLSSKCEVCEEFIGFVRLEKLDAQTIADTLLHVLQELGFNMSGVVGQGYDGASVMSSSKNGVQAKVAEKYPNATYIHCRSLGLNLAILSGCKAVRSIPSV